VQCPKPPKTEPDLGLKPGQVIDGRFVVEHLLGAGGQGVVFKVRHLEWNRDFALKIPLPQSIETHVARERYLTEAQTWIRMGVHPNIVRCWFVKEVASLPGLFLDLVTGGTLEDRIESGQFQAGDWGSVLKTVLELTEGLLHSHSKGVVHRDLKPENLMIREDGVLSITDFGLVKVQSVDSEEDASNSLIPEEAMGTPRYGAPEQWVEPSKVGTATDLYSFGAILYELICGQRPFDPPGRGGGALAIINRHITETPPHPLDIRAGIPEQLVQLCLQCLEKDPAKRPPSTAFILDWLGRISTSVCGQPHQRPASVPTGERPDLLNNAAASLFSLGKTRLARELLLKGLMIEAGHPECLYNLVQMDRREGLIDRPESFRRLRRAKALFPMALLYLEECQGLKAAEILERIPSQEKSGYAYRTEGDALMYAGKYRDAELAYDEAHRLMPNDLPSAFRKELAASRSIRKGGRTYFPTLTSFYTSRAPSPEVEIVLSPESDRIIGVNKEELVSLCLQTDSVLMGANREKGSCEIVRTWTGPNRLLIQDRRFIELWCLEPLECLQRVPGRVLTASQDLSRLALLTDKGVILVSDQIHALKFPPDIPRSRSVLVSFGPHDTDMCLMTPDGRLASVNNKFDVVPLAWPPAFPEPASMGLLQLGNNTVYVATHQGVVHGLDMANEIPLFTYDLGFSPERVRIDSQGRTLAFSSPKAFTLLTKRGKLLLRGTGPCAVDAKAKYALVCPRGYLELYQLHPFQRLRAWEEKISPPRRLQLSHDGRRGVTLDATGEYKVWEVDEPNRVYERSMLFTPGQSYEEVIASYEAYAAEFQQALIQFQKKQYYPAYQSLLRARSVSGFHQTEEALELQWALCGLLKRDGLDDVWERLYIPDVISGQLSSDCRHLLLATTDRIELSELSGPVITEKLGVDSPRGLLGASYLPSHPKGSLVVTLTKDAFLRYTHVETAELLHEQQLPLSALNTVLFGSEVALIQAEKHVVIYDLTKNRMRAPLPLRSRLQSAFLLDEETAFLVTDKHHLFVDLKKGAIRPGVPLKMEKFPGHITFVGDSTQANLRMTGFSDGTLLLSLAKTGEPLFGINQENGPVTGAAINLETSLGVSVSEKGGITFFDLSAGRILERFVAHGEGVSRIGMTQDGRYTTTLSRSGQFRLWEVSWALTDEQGSRQIDWLPSKRGLGKLFGRGKKG
jgi:tetratricopeptide (TPR) repeat protein/tRNA A-37 threonylcarbamoyl transferase component Bud32